MSAIKAAYEAALADLHNAAAKLEQIGHDGWARVKEIARELEGDAPKLADEAKTDAEDVVHTAETQGVVPAEHEAEGDAVQLAQGAVHDVADALAGSSKAAEPDPAQTTAQTTAVIASEAAVATEPNA